MSACWAARDAVQRTSPLSRKRQAAIAGRLDDPTLMQLNRLVQNGVVTCQGVLHGFWMAFPQLGAAFDVREQEGGGHG